MTINVLSVTNMYPTDERPYSGIFVQEYMSAMSKLGVEFTLSFTDTERGRRAYFREFNNIRHQLARREFDLIHVHHTYCMYQVKLAQFLTRDTAPVLSTTHEGESLIPGDVRNTGADWIKKIVYFKRPKKWALQMAESVVSVNEHIPPALGFRKDFHVIPPGVDLELFRPLDKLDCRTRLGLSSEEKVVFFPANPENPYKGYEIVQQSLRNLPVETTVVTGGTVSHGEMPVYMNAADVVVQASSFEASPMVAKEAMATNVPMVSTDTGDIRRTFGETPGYFLCERNPDDLAAKIGLALQFEGETGGRERILELGLSLEQVAQKYYRLYNEVVSRSS